MMKTPGVLIRIFLPFYLTGFLGMEALSQATGCTFKTPFFLLHFGTGNVQDVNTASPALYDRVSSSCPTDGHYSLASFTADCFHGDWHTLTEDHTPGDAGGNMLLVNSAYERGVFLTTRVNGFKSETVYQLGVWLMNVCKPSEKCPFPLLPNLTIRLQTPAGKTVAQFATGELPRRSEPQWTQHKAEFTMPPSETSLLLTMSDDAPGGCGNDFALDDLTFSECVKTVPPKLVEPKKTPPATTSPPKKKAKERTPSAPPSAIPGRTATVTSGNKEVISNKHPLTGPRPVEAVAVPLLLKQRTNPIVRHIETGPGEILLALFDNGEIDGDTVSVYHNNALIVAHQRLSQAPLSFRIQVDKSQPHHELVMIAENLGSIPPNTSLMTVTAKDKRYEVFISTTTQQNAKVVIDLKE